MNKNPYQTMPRKGELAKNLNLPIEALLERITSFRQETVYSYVVATVKYNKGQMYQQGSGPNFQGDLVTLCSCKHWMRTFQDIESRIGVWVAGYTSRSHYGENDLFYLMRISKVYLSHRDFWSSNSVLEETKIAKAAHMDRFGDIYQPKCDSGDPHSHGNYLPPCKEHVHCEPGDWRKDIEYTGRYGKKPVLLVGDQKLSFLWDEPVLSSPFDIPRGQKKTRLSDFFPIMERH